MRILWVYFNVLVYVFFHFIPIRKRYKHPEKYSLEECYKYVGKICEIIVRKSGSQVIIEGRENLLNEPVLYTCNHPSMIDPYFAGYAIGKALGAVIAGDLWFDRIPVVAPMFKSIGCIFVDRKNPREGIKGINRGVENIKKGHSLIIFPEGEITKIISDDVVAEYQAGGLKLALKPKVPIIPIVLIGTDKIYSAHEVVGKLKKGKIYIKILPPYVKHIHEDISAKTVSDEIRQLTIDTILNNNIE